MDGRKLTHATLEELRLRAKQKNKPSQFKITGAKGIHISFANGWTVSIQFGYGNYTTPRVLYGEYCPTCARQPDAEASTVEVAAWHKDDDAMIALSKHDQVLACVTAEEVAGILSFFSALPKKKQANVADKFQAQFSRD